MSLFNVEAAMAAQMSPAPAVRPTGIFPGVPAGQSTTDYIADIMEDEINDAMKFWGQRLVRYSKLNEFA